MTAGLDSKAARSTATAEFLLIAAASLNVKVGTDGENLVTLSRGVPVGVINALERALTENKAAVIAAIEADVAARAGAAS
jgi:hypothetical protein